MSAEEVATYILSAQTNSEAYLTYCCFRSKLPGWKFVLASDRGVSPGLAVNRSFAHGGAIRSPFASNHVVVFDELTSEEMKGGRANFYIDFSISLDTQALSSIQPFMEGNTNRLPKDFQEALMFLARPEVNCDPMPYIWENLRNLNNPKNHEKIFRKIRGYEILRSIDISHLNEKCEIRSRLTEAELNKNAQETLAGMLYRASDKGFADFIASRHLIFYCLLTKMAEIHLTGAKLNEKMFRFLDFMHTDVAAIFVPESLVASKYFQDGQDLDFFGKIQAGRTDIFQSLSNMAWDLLHLRHLEEGLTFNSGEARYYFPAILTFDNRLLKIIHAYSLRSCAIVPGERIAMPFYATDWFETVTQCMSEAEREKVSALGSSQSKAARAAQNAAKKANLNQLVSNLEEQLAIAAKIDLSQARSTYPPF